MPHELMKKLPYVKNKTRLLKPQTSIYQSGYLISIKI